MKPRALVVDDNRALAEDLGEILDGEGYQVRVFDDPKRALAESTGFDFDYALLDVRMPELDGWSLLNALEREHPRAHFVLMTAYGDDVRRMQGLPEGARPGPLPARAILLFKPFSPVVLLRTLANLAEAP